jgi:hypothetical protein
MNGSWMKYRIRIDGDQVVEIFFVLTGHDVTGSVGVREGVQKCLKTTLQQLYKWVFGSVLATSTKYRML